MAKANKRVDPRGAPAFSMPRSVDIIAPFDRGLTETEIDILRAIIADNQEPPAPAGRPAHDCSIGVGAFVRYRLSRSDVDQILARRRDRRLRGNAPMIGQSCPALVVAMTPPDILSLKVFLDGEDELWTERRAPGEGHGRWFSSTAIVGTRDAV